MRLPLVGRDPGGMKASLARLLGSLLQGFAYVVWSWEDHVVPWLTGRFPVPKISFLRLLALARALVAIPAVFGLARRQASLGQRGMVPAGGLALLVGFPGSPARAGQGEAVNIAPQLARQRIPPRVCPG